MLKKYPETDFQTDNLINIAWISDLFFSNH